MDKYDKELDEQIQQMIQQMKKESQEWMDNCEKQKQSEEGKIQKEAELRKKEEEETRAFIKEELERYKILVGELQKNIEELDKELKNG